MTVLPFVLPTVPEELDADEVAARLSENAVRAIYERLGIEQFRSGGVGNWRVSSPFREDRRPSFTIRKDDGVWSDKATGEGGTIFQAIQRHEECDFKEALRIVADVVGKPPRAMQSVPESERRIVATYDYTDPSGASRYQVVRYEPKDFRQRRPNGSGGWTWNLDGIERVLYRLPELLAADPVDYVYVVEGEKDADHLVSEGLVATTSAQGAGKWLPEYAESLRGRNVVVIPDNDDPGERHATDVVRSLLPLAASVRLVRLDGLPVKGDVSDWFEAGGNGFTLEVLADAMPVVQPQDLKPGAVVVDLSSVMPREIDWIWNRWLPRGKLTLLGGQGGQGKSTLTAWLAALLSRGGKWPDGTPAPLLRVLFLVAEDALDDTLVPRLDAHEADRRCIKALTFIREDGKGGMREVLFDLGRHLPMLEAAVREHDIDVVIIDPLSSFLQGVKRNDEGEIRDRLMPLVAFANRAGLAIVGIMHTGKPNGTSRSPVQTLLGSVGFGNIARMVWMISPTSAEPNAPRVFGVAKTNLASEPPAFEFVLDEASGSVQWNGVSDVTLAQAMSASVSVSPERQDILDFLRQQGRNRPQTAEQIATALGKKTNTIYYLLHQMAKSEVVERVATGLYTLPIYTPKNTKITKTTTNTKITKAES